MGEQVAAGESGGLAQLGERLPCKQEVTQFDSRILHSAEAERMYIENCTQRVIFLDKK